MKGAILRDHINANGGMFQSAPPVKGAMASFCGYAMTCWFQSAPPVKGAIGGISRFVDRAVFQSAPPVKGAMGFRFPILLNRLFQSAPPVKGAIAQPDFAAGQLDVSIRAPREGGDSGFAAGSRMAGRFNPRPP